MAGTLASAGVPKVSDSAFGHFMRHSLSFGMRPMTDVAGV